jgi:hypothetical protein
MCGRTLECLPPPPIGLPPPARAQFIDHGGDRDEFVCDKALITGDHVI